MNKYGGQFKYLAQLSHVYGDYLYVSKNKNPIIGLTVTIKSVIGIYDDYVKNERIKYLLTYKLSQDHLEYVIELKVTNIN